MVINQLQSGTVLGASNHDANCPIDAQHLEPCGRPMGTAQHLPHEVSTQKFDSSCVLNKKRTESITRPCPQDS